MSAHARYATVDMLRGLAVMGILLMNITDFALPSGAYFNPLAGGGTKPVDLAVWALSFVLVDGKMRALFSILFGASTLIVVERAEAAGLSGTRIHFARMATLALFGLVHLFLIWPGDILLHYALIGIVALPFVAFEPRQQIKIAILLLCAQFVIGALFFTDFLTLRHAAGQPGASAAMLIAWHGFIDGVGIGRAPDVAAEIAVARGPWSGFVAHNLATQASAPPFLLAFNGLETLAFMLIGMAALRSGFLTGGWTRARYLRLSAIGFAIGLPPTIALCWLSVASGFDTLATFAAGTLGGLPFRPILALAEAALALALLSNGRHRRLEAAGRAAFSNYLGTSIAMMLVFDGWGLGQFGRVERIWLYPIVGIVWLAILGWSPAWLARFRYGPLEWAWRSLARGKPQAMRINDIATVSQ